MKAQDAPRCDCWDQAAPAVAVSNVWLETPLQRLSASFDPTKAVCYLLSFCAALNRQVDDGRIDIDNSAAERSTRGIGMGRKDCLFSGAEVGTCAMNLRRDLERNDSIWNRIQRF